MAKIKYVEAKNDAELDKLINNSIRSVQKAREHVQIAAVAVLLHAAKHGDWTKANVLVEGLGSTVNGQALVKFFVDYGGLTTNAESSAFGGWQGAEYIREHLDAAKEKMWWDLRKVNPFAGYNADTELNRFVEKHRKMVKTIAGLTPEDQGKVSFIISDKTMAAVLSLVDFEHIVAVVREEREHEAEAAEAPAADANDNADAVVDQQAVMH